MKRLFIIIFLSFLLCLVLTAASITIFADEKKEKEKFTGNVIGQPGTEAGSIRKLTMVIDRWTSPEEVKELYSLTKDYDSESRFKAIRKKTAGYMWFTNSARFPLNIASNEDTDKGRMIRLIIEHPILPGEIYRSLPEPNNQFGAVEFILRENNEGEGFIFGRVTVSIYEDGTVIFKPLASIKQMLKTVRKK